MDWTGSGQTKSPSGPKSPSQGSNNNCTKQTSCLAIWQLMDRPLSSHQYSGASCLLNNGHRSLRGNWILLDSCSTVNIVRNKKLLKDIRYTKDRVSINCNAGNLQVMQQGRMDRCSSPLWFHPHCVANIFSLFLIVEEFCIMFDSGTEDCFYLHRHDGSRMDFHPTAQGLYRHVMEPSTHPGDLWSLVTTMSDKAHLYDNRSHSNAATAQRLQNITMCPSTKTLHEVATKYMLDCPVT